MRPQRRISVFGLSKSARNLGKCEGSTLKPSHVYVDILEGLLGSLHAARKRWRTLDRQGIRAVFRELKAQRKNLIRQEDLYPPNDPLRLAFQCQRAAVDLHLAELRKVAAGNGVARPKVGED